MATVLDCVPLLMHTNESTVAILESVRPYVWVLEDVAGMILFQMFHTAFIIPVHARVSFQPKGIIKAGFF